MADDLEQEEKKKGREEAEQSKALDTLTDHVRASDTARTALVMEFSICTNRC